MKSFISLFMAATFLISTCVPAYARNPKADTIHIDNVDLGHHISPGDTLSVEVFPAKEYSREVVVQPDGTIEMLMIGLVTARDLTSAQLAALLAQKLSKYVVNPQVNVSIRIFSARVVTIAGEVYAAGTYDFKDGMRVLDILLKGGGPKDGAKLTRIKVFRKEGDKIMRYNVDFNRFVEGNFNDNMELRPQDMVYVPTTPFTKTSRWINDNIVPWAAVITLGLTIVLLTRHP